MAEKRGKSEHGGRVRSAVFSPSSNENLCPTPILDTLRTLSSHVSVCCVHPNPRLALQLEQQFICQLCIWFKFNVRTVTKRSCVTSPNSVD